MIRRIIVALCFCLLFASRANAQMAVGMNLAAPSDWSRAWVWKDQLRQARWLAGNNWWLVQWGHEHYPAGRWVAEWTGDDSPKFVRGVRVVDELLPGLAALDVGVPTKGLAVEPFGDAKMEHLWMPGVNRGGSPFHPEYVERLRPFKVLRFMDWQATNLSTVSDWSQRRFVETPQQWTPKDAQGVALEYCIDLASEVGADPWLCIPHLATDDFVKRLAELLRDRLAAGRIVYLEWGNEIAWNRASGFDGGRWLAANSLLTGVRPVDYYGGRVKRINELARPILGARLKIVVAGQANNPWIAEQECNAAGRGNFDAVSCAWYFGLPKGFVGDAATTVDDVLELCQRDIDGRLVERLAAHANLAKGYNVPLLLYEGGQHLNVAATSPIADEVLAAQRHPRMGDLYRLALQRCRESGATLAVAYSDVSPWSPAGSWGAREHMSDTDSPKWRALVEEAAR